MKLSTLIGLLFFICLSSAQAEKPLWTFVPVPGYSPSVKVKDIGTATIQYTVTNQSHRIHTLQMEPISGITATGCNIPLAYQQSCLLNLTVNGSTLSNNITGGPKLCSQGNPWQCYQPAIADRLAISLLYPIYTLTPAAGSNGTIKPDTPQKVYPGDNFTFTATPDTGYVINQWLLDGQLVQTGGESYQLSDVTANHTVSVTFANNMTTLSVSVSRLALSVKGLEEFGLTPTTSGISRVISIKNTGEKEVTGLTISYPAWPGGTPSTEASSTCTSTLAVDSSCIITITPGTIATSDDTGEPCSTGTTPVPGTIQIIADNAIPVSSNVVVLDYGCEYQGGYVYAFDDTTPNTGSVGGKVVTTVDQESPLFPDGIIWSSNGAASGGVGGLNPAGTSLDTIPGIDETSTSLSGSPTYDDTFVLFFSSTYTNPNPFTSASFPMCNGISDGSCNTDNILTFYNQFITNNTQANGDLPPPRFTADAGPTITRYAAGLCKKDIAGYNDWYLPAICEMGYGRDFCGTAAEPTLQNIQFSVNDRRLDAPKAPRGSYWSSTEYQLNPQDIAWSQFFGISTNNGQSFLSKANGIGVRCSRALTF